MSRPEKFTWHAGEFDVIDSSWNLVIRTPTGVRLVTTVAELGQYVARCRPDESLASVVADLDRRGQFAEAPAELVAELTHLALLPQTMRRG